MLAIFAGGREALAEKPTAVFDVCPSPPLIWSEFGAQNLIDLAPSWCPRADGLDAPGGCRRTGHLGGLSGPACRRMYQWDDHPPTSQPRLADRVGWGARDHGYAARYDPMGAVETAMIDAAYAQVGKSFGLPTHTYLGASDAKIVDAQAGMESSTTAMIGALAGINMISGAGMLDFLACMSPEKLVIDAEAIGMAQRCLKGMMVHTETLATEMFEGINFKGEFLKQRTTRKLIQKEQYMPSPVIDRGSIRTWQQMGSTDTFERAKIQVVEIWLHTNLPICHRSKWPNSTYGFGFSQGSRYGDNFLNSNFDVSAQS